MREMILIVTWVLAMCLQISAVGAQDAVPGEILARVLFVKWRTEAGTAFRVDHKNKIYLVTARHVVEGVPESNAIIQVRREDTWEDYHTVRTLYPSSNDVDIAVFETSETVPQPFAVTPMDSITFGQQVWFIGYPFGMGTLVAGQKGPAIPFMKRGSMSAIDATNHDAVVYYIDGLLIQVFLVGLWCFGILRLTPTKILA